MDEIFADVTEIIKRTATTDENNTHDGDGGASARIAGNLYAPGTGGHLLEAQTGLEISLDDAGGAANGSDGGSGGGSSRSSGGMVQALSGPESGDSQGDDAVGTGEYGGAKGSAAGKEGESGGGGFRCRCGCLERLSATSKFAERVRRGLLEVVGGLDLGAVLLKANAAVRIMFTVGSCLWLCRGALAL